jgi:EAL and modified HD-GYP domain-containing signal transduction protein
MERDGTARFFTMGILSTMDAHLDTELATALQQMTLSSEMLDALLRHGGSMGAILQTSTGFEQGRLEKVPWRALREFGLDQKTVEDAYLDSLQWAGETLAALAEAMPPAARR